jgi:hypothetical protein
VVGRVRLAIADTWGRGPAPQQQAGAGLTGTWLYISVIPRHACVDWRWYPCVTQARAQAAPSASACHPMPACVRVLLLQGRGVGLPHSWSSQWSLLAPVGCRFCVAPVGCILPALLGTWFRDQGTHQMTYTHAHVHALLRPCWHSAPIPGRHNTAGCLPQEPPAPNDSKLLISADWRGRHCAQRGMQSSSRPKSSVILICSGQGVCQAVCVWCVCGGGLVRAPSRASR